MGFATPAALFFLALFIPIILLYLLKQRRRRVQVSTLMFWDKILRDEQSVTSLTRLRKLLSLALQLIFVALLALALARPLFSSDMLGARRIVVFVDVSASMTVLEASGTRFDEAKRSAIKVANGMSIGDTIMIVAVSSEPDIVLPFTDNRKEALDAIEGLEVSHGATDFGAAFSVLDHLPPDDRASYVYVISDGAFENVEFDVPERMQFAYLPVGEESENVGITAFRLRPLPASPRDFEILFEVANGTEQEQRIPFEVRVGDSLIDAGELTIPAGGELIRTLRQFSVEGGVVQVLVDYADAFPLDNSAFGVLPRVVPIPVLLVTTGNLFLETALSTDDAVELEVMTPIFYSLAPDALPHPMDDYVTIFDRAVPNGDQPSKAIYIGAWPTELALGSNRRLESPLITEWDRDHPINRHLQFTNVSIEATASFTPIPGFETLIRSFNDPLMAYGSSPAGEALIIAFDTQSTDLPLRVAFPILIANAIRHMAWGEEGVWTQPFLGGLLSYGDVTRYVDDVEEGDTLSLRKPGQDEASTLEEKGLYGIDRAGVYYAVHGDHEHPMFAANLTDSDESRIAPSESLPISSASPLPMIEEGLRLGREPWLVLATLALILTLTEWALFHRRLVE